MRKRSGRPNRFAAVPNETVDDAVSLDFMALALLTVLIRHQDGWDITLAEVGAKYGYGRDAMAKAMGLLQVARYVVKVRIMSAGDNQWSTEVVVYDIPATDDEIAELLANIERESDVRAVQVIEPTKSAVEIASKRRGKLAPKRTKKHDITVPPRGSAKAGAAGKDAAGQSAEGQEQGAAAAKPKTPPRKTAAPKAGASKPKAAGTRLSKEQAAAVRTVEEAFPQELQDLLPSYRPQVLRDTILQALDSRTAAQIAERVQRRWWAHGYSVDAMPEGKGIGSPVGVAVGLVRPSTDCPDPMCEDGVTIDLGVGCRACEERKADRKADRHTGRVPEQREEQRPAPVAPAQWTCDNPVCRTPGRGAPPQDGLCPACRQEMREVAARIEADHAATEAAREQAAAAAWEDMLQDAYADHAEWEAAAAERRQEREEAERRRRERDEETRLLREQILRENPELAAFAQST